LLRLTRHPGTIGVETVGARTVGGFHHFQPLFGLLESFSLKMAGERNTVKSLNSRGIAKPTDASIRLTRFPAGSAEGGVTAKGDER
jgi:hypothetical protein